MTINGKCYCGEITWKITGKVDFTSACHCKDCQTISGSGYGSTSLMIYDPKGVEIDGKPTIYHAESEAGNHTQRGFCPTCGTVLFNHVSEGEEDEHWAVRTGGMADSRSLRMDKEIFMKSKLPWVPIITKPQDHYIGMPKRKNKDSQTTINETLNEKKSDNIKLPVQEEEDNRQDDKEAKDSGKKQQKTIEESTNGVARVPRKKRQKTS